MLCCGRGWFEKLEVLQKQESLFEFDVVRKWKPMEHEAEHENLNTSDRRQQTVFRLRINNNDILMANNHRDLAKH